MTVSKFCRQAITALAIVAFAPLGLAVLDMTPSAYAKGGGKGGGGGHGGGGGDHGNGGGHGNGNGNGSGNGNGNGSGKPADADQASASKSAKGLSKKSVIEDPSLHPSALGKLNGVLNASLNAYANASPNSPIGTAATALRDALAANEDLDPTNDMSPEEMGAIMDSITNKEVTAAQVQAVADRLAEINPELSRYDLDAEQDPAVEAENQAMADAIADEANELKGIEPEPDNDLDNNGVPDDLE